MEISTVSSQNQQKEEDSQIVSYSIEFPLVYYENDSLFNKSGNFQILPLKQTGVNLPGHYLKIEPFKQTGVNITSKFRLTANATWDDPKSHFNIYTVWSDLNNNPVYINIVESAMYPRQVMAVVNDAVVVKKCSKSPMEYHTLQEILKSDPEILWINKPMTPSSIYSSYRLYTTGSTNYYLAFSNGKPLTPSTVNPVRDEAYFIVR